MHTTFQGAALKDTNEIRGLRIRALAEVQNLQNALMNGAYPNALIFRADHAHHAVRHLAETQMERPHLEPAVNGHDH